MKNHVTLALALLTGMSFAQPYNNTYNVNANGDRLNPAFTIVDSQEESVTVSNGTDGLSNYFVLTKLDVSGNHVFNCINRSPNDPQDGYIHVEAIHQTDDRGYIVGGYWYKDINDVREQPFISKFDNAGVWMWTKIYYVNQRAIVTPEINKVSFERVWDQDAEAYFFVVAGDSDVNPGTEVATNVIKVDANGNIIFSYKYYNASPDGFIDVREYPGDIEYSSRDRMYMITGFRTHVNAETGGQEYLMYYFGIRNDGSMFNNYTTLESKSVPIDQDMVYDEREDNFATAFTHERNGYVQGKRSVIGYIEMNSGMNYTDPGYLWHNEGYTHNGRSISHRREGGYAIGSGTYDDVSVFVNNPALQFVDYAGNPTSNYMRYNVRDDVYFGHHAWNENRDEYVLVSEQGTDLRTISTDPAGEACGMRRYEPNYKPYDPKQRFYKYYPEGHWKQMEYKTYQKCFEPKYRKCEGEGDHYRMAATGITSYTDNDQIAVVYPTMINSSQAYVTVENKTGADVKIEVRNITGQLVFSSESIGAGKNEINLGGNSSLAPGMYLVNVLDSKGQLNTSTKIVVSR
jgi:hypothetical protein